MVAFSAQHCLLTASTTQIPIALSSVEAEFYGLLARRAGPSAWSLCTAASAWWSRPELLQTLRRHSEFAQRHGCGKVRHLETSTLWVQRALKLGHFSLVKLPGKLNCADLGSKHFDATTMKGHLERMNLVLVNEPHETALKARV